MRISALVLVAVVLGTSGCAAIKGQAIAKWPWPSTSASDFPCTGTNGACTDANALRAYLRASEFCRELHNHYENGGRGSDAGKFGLGALGVLAGSVFAPISHGTAATAWSGLSGSVNALQMSMEETFSSTIAANRRQAITKEVTSGQDNFSDGDEAEEKVVAAINMALNCSLAPATADSKSLRDLTSKTTGPTE